VSASLSQLLAVAAPDPADRHASARKSALKISAAVAGLAIIIPETFDYYDRHAAVQHERFG